MKPGACGTPAMSPLLVPAALGGASGKALARSAPPAAGGVEGVLEPEARVTTLHQMGAVLCVTGRSVNECPEGSHRFNVSLNGSSTSTHQSSSTAASTSRYFRGSLRLLELKQIRRLLP
jgi:hypothetical protein